MFVCNFADPDLEVNIFFENKGATEQWSIDFEIMGLHLLYTRFGVSVKFPADHISFFVLFFFW